MQCLLVNQCVRQCLCRHFEIIKLLVQTGAHITPTSRCAGMVMCVGGGGGGGRGEGKGRGREFPY